MWGPGLKLLLLQHLLLAVGRQASHPLARHSCPLHQQQQQVLLMLMLELQARELLRPGQQQLMTLGHLSQCCQWWSRWLPPLPQRR